MSNDVNVRRVLREVNVLRTVVEGMQALGGERPPTFYPNPNDNCLTAFAVERVPLDRLAEFLGVLHGALSVNQIGVMLDAVVLKPVSGDPREHSLKKKMFVNLSLCTWTRENLMRLVKLSRPDDKFYAVDILTTPFDPAEGSKVSILDRLEADAEVLRFENECEEPERRRPVARSKSKNTTPRAPLITAEALQAVLEQAVLERFDLGAAGKVVLPALGLGFVNKEESDD